MVRILTVCLAEFWPAAERCHALRLAWLKDLQRHSSYSVVRVHEKNLQNLWSCLVQYRLDPFCMSHFDAMTCNDMQ